MLGSRDQEYERWHYCGERCGGQADLTRADIWGGEGESSAAKWGGVRPDPPLQWGLKGGGESGSFLSLSPGPYSPAAGRGARSPPGRAPRRRPGGAGDNGTGRGGAEESGGTERGPGSQGTSVGRYRRLRYLRAAPQAGSSAPPVPAGGSGAPAGSGTTGRLRCPVAAAHPGGSGVPAPGRGEGGSGRSQASGRGRPGRSSAPPSPGTLARAPSEGSTQGGFAGG